jgi:hypothetical protein
VEELSLLLHPFQVPVDLEVREQTSSCLEELARVLPLEKQLIE